MATALKTWARLRSVFGAPLMDGGEAARTEALYGIILQPSPAPALDTHNVEFIGGFFLTDGGTMIRTDANPFNIPQFGPPNAPSRFPAFGYGTVDGSEVFIEQRADESLFASGITGVDAQDIDQLVGENFNFSGMSVVIEAGFFTPTGQPVPDPAPESLVSIDKMTYVPPP